jgi:hypothetical protein
VLDQSSASNLDAPEISDAPPKVVDKRLTGRICEEWKRKTANGS